MSARTFRPLRALRALTYAIIGDILHVSSAALQRLGECWSTLRLQVRKRRKKMSFLLGNGEKLLPQSTDILESLAERVRQSAACSDFPAAVNWSAHGCGVIEPG